MSTKKKKNAMSIIYVLDTQGPTCRMNVPTLLIKFLKGVHHFLPFNQN